MYLINADEIPLNTTAYTVAHTLPKADAVIVIHATWELDGKDHCHCTNCKFGRDIVRQIGWAYCPWCGAKMSIKDGEK